MLFTMSKMLIKLQSETTFLGSVHTFVNKSLLKESHVHSFTYGLLLLSGYAPEINVTETIAEFPRLKCLISDPLQKKKIADL